MEDTSSSSVYVPDSAPARPQTTSRPHTPAKPKTPSHTKPWLDMDLSGVEESMRKLNECMKNFNTVKPVPPEIITTVTNDIYIGDLSLAGSLDFSNCLPEYTVPSIDTPNSGGLTQGNDNIINNTTTVDNSKPSEFIEAVDMNPVNKDNVSIGNSSDITMNNADKPVIIPDLIPTNNKTIDDYIISDDFTAGNG